MSVSACQLVANTKIEAGDVTPVTSPAETFLELSIFRCYRDLDREQPTVIELLHKDYI